MIKKYTLKALEQALQQALALDPDSEQRLRALSGKRLHLVITPLNVGFYLCFTDDGLKLAETIDGIADTSIHASPIGLIRLSILPASKARSLFNDRVRMSGDILLGERVKALFDDLDIDWEGHLAAFTGDVVAHQLGQVVRGGMDFIRGFKQSMQANVSEYIQDELRMAPSALELDDFSHAVDELAMATERLAAKIDLIKADDDENH